MPNNRLQKIRSLNDRFRTREKSPYGLRISEGVTKLGRERVKEILKRVEAYRQFTPDVDRSGEHADGRIQYGTDVIRWYIEYMGYGAPRSPDPSKPTCTWRVLAIELEDEFIAFYGE